MSETPELTPEQRKVVDQPADARVLVTAGAGAGKTHTLVRRLDRLVDEEELSAGEILVLTFSRAAVRELSDRLTRHGEAARFVRARTFDSWALEVLLQVDVLGGWEDRSFGDRIDGAREAIENGLADELYGDDQLLHVVIDEVQDLVGARRELVETLLERFGCGFTVVGDPAQSIYGFTLGPKSTVEERQAETNRFFVWLRNTFGEELTELNLTANFRAQTSEAEIALGFGPQLRASAESGSGVTSLYDDLRTTLRSGALNLGTLDELIARAIGGWDGTTAILCRTNGQALQVSEQLHTAGVEHRLQRSARDRVAPAWLGLLIRAVDGALLSRARFDELAAALPLPAELSPAQLWRLLLRTGIGRGNDRSVDLRRLRAALASGRLPDELTAQPASRIVVSSFHRAKGLEFDQVVIVDPGVLRLDDDKKSKKTKARAIDPVDEARSLYVAMTRPRRELYWLDALDSAQIRLDRETGRWGRYGWRYWVRGGVEITGGDVFTDRPAGTKVFDADPLDMQEYLATRVRPGDEVTLERVVPEPIALDESPDYTIIHDGRPIGTASERFRTQLYRHMQTSRNYVPQNWPRLLTGVRIDAVETVAGSEAAGREAGLGPHGVWIAPRLMGLSVFVYDQKAEEDTGVTAR
ncbi:ATP-dependent helicase [Actinocorallia libanotica]|uniref:DNA 3'-5' helicase n=1 Tax=Actinocorallia libanotica TaxID=46162 RepID=A0ABP4BRE1_9ACTN